MDTGRSRLVAAVVVVAAATGLIAIALAAGGGSEEPAGDLKVELAPDNPSDLVVYVPAATNVPGTAGGRPTVTLECLDRGDEVVARSRQAWPFTDTDGETLDPHVHQFVPPGRARRIERCRLLGTKGPLEGRVRAPVG
jgi:hypothetical protein